MHAREVYFPTILLSVRLNRSMDLLVMQCFSIKKKVSNYFVLYSDIRVLVFLFKIAFFDRKDYFLRKTLNL